MAKRKSKNLWWFLIVAAAIGGGLYWWRTKQPAAADIAYRTATVVRADVVQSVTANGQLSPLVSVDIGSQVSGNILKLYVDFNSKVTNGQLIAELDDATYSAHVIQADGELANARAQFSLAKINAKRAQDLLASKLVAQSDFDQTMALLEQSEATMKQREASLQSARVDFARTKIYSPIEGTVISRNMNVGQTVQASFSSPTLFQIANDLTRMQIGAMVSEADIGGVEDGQEVSFTVEAFPNRTFRGRVSQVRNQPTTNQNVVTYATMIDVRNSDLKLKPGMTANVSITTAKKEKALRVPNGALRFRPPEGAVVSSNTIRLASAGTNASPPGLAASSGGDDGLPEFPGGFQPSPEMRKRMIERYDKDGDGKLDEAERAALLEARKARMASGGGPGGGGEGGSSRGGGGGGGSGSGRMRGESTNPLRTVYLVSTNTAAGGSKIVQLQPVQVKTGISDGVSTEILEGLKEGDVIAAGTIGGAAAPATAAGPAPGNPFGGPFGGGRRF